MKAFVPWGLLVWALVATTGYYSRSLREHEVAAPDHADLGRIPTGIASWSGSDLRFDPRIYQVLGADTTLMRRYVDASGGPDQWLFVAYFKNQRTGAQIHSPKNCLPGGGWNIIRRETVPLPVEGHTVGVNRFLISRGAERQVVYYWFLTRAGIVTDEYLLKFDLVRNAVLRRPTDAAFVRISSAVPEGGLDASDAAAVRLLTALGPPMQAALPFPAREAY